VAKTLAIHPERGTACRACELACSMKHHGEFNPNRSRMQANVSLMNRPMIQAKPLADFPISRSSFV
jgi:Fe-S-cluster-containing hydrogenase component 2